MKAKCKRMDASSCMYNLADIHDDYRHRIIDAKGLNILADAIRMYKKTSDKAIIGPFVQAFNAITSTYTD
jgi:hypothetical protein